MEYVRSVLERDRRRLEEIDLVSMSKPPPTDRVLDSLTPFPISKLVPVRTENVIFILKEFHSPG